MRKLTFLLLFLAAAFSSTAQQDPANKRMPWNGLPRIDIDLPAGKTVGNIDKDTKLKCGLKISNAYGSNFPASQLYNGFCTIKGRGNSSWAMPKKPFALVTTNASFAKLSATPFGMPAEYDWVLLADANDKSFMRNPLALRTGTVCGAFWSPATQKVELYFDSVYQGLYTFTEKIKKGPNRIPVTVTTGLNTGWTVEQQPYFQIGALEQRFQDVRGAWYSYKEPDSEEVTDSQNTSIKRQLDTALNALLNGGNYRDFIDVPSFVNRFILEDLVMNNDAGLASWYLTRRTPTSKIEAFPPWDYNLALAAWVANPYIIAPSYTDFTDPNGPFLARWIDYMGKLMQDSVFASEVQTQYLAVLADLHQLLGDYRVFVPQLVATGAVARDRAKWTTFLNDPLYLPRATYQEETDAVADFYRDRLYWMTVRAYDFVAAKSVAIQPGAKPVTTYTDPKPVFYVP